MRTPTPKMIGFLVRLASGEQGGQVASYSDSMHREKVHHATITGLMARGLIEVDETGRLWLTLIGEAWLIDTGRWVKVESGNMSLTAELDVNPMTPEHRVFVAKRFRAEFLGEFDQTEEAMAENAVKPVDDHLNNVGRHTDIRANPLSGRRWVILSEVELLIGRDTGDPTLYFVATWDYHTNNPKFDVVSLDQLTNLY